MHFILRIIFILGVICSTLDAQIYTELNTPKIIQFQHPSHIYTPVVITLNKSSTYGFVLTQLHSQYSTLVSSMNQVSTYGYENNATHTGLVNFISHSQLELTTYVGSNSTNSLSGIFYAVPYERNSPVPGACCIICALENDPNIKITYNPFKTELTINRASCWWDPLLGEIPPCDNQENPETFRLTYDVYYKYLDENDLTVNGLFSALFEMLTPESITKVATHLVTIKNAESLTFTTETVFGQGVIFNVIVSDAKSGLSSAYVPAATYSCDFVTGECTSYGSKTALSYCIIFAIIGIVMCFGGFKCFRIWLFLSGMIFYWFIIYITIARLTSKFNSLEVLIISSLCSLVGGAFVLFLFAFKKLVYVCILQICITFGMLVSAIIFYTPFGYLEMWDVDYRFALGYCCVILFVTAVFLFYPRIGIYLSSSLLGSYAVIMLPNYFLRTNMQYIVVTVLFRFTISDFGSSFLRRPYQIHDYILTGVWAGLFLIGFIVQYCTTKNDDFIVSGKAVRKQVWQKFSESVKISKHRRKEVEPKKQYYKPPHTERTPLLSGNNEELPRSVLAFDNSSASNSTVPSSTTFHPVRYEPESDILPPSHSHESREYQPMLHHQGGYGATQTPASQQPPVPEPSAPPIVDFNQVSASPPPSYQERYPKMWNA